MPCPAANETRSQANGTVTGRAPGGSSAAIVSVLASALPAVWRYSTLAPATETGAPVAAGVAAIASETEGELPCVLNTRTDATASSVTTPRVGSGRASSHPLPSTAGGRGATAVAIVTAATIGTASSR